MKVKKEIEVTVCDFCGKDTWAGRTCAVCGKDVCGDCDVACNVSYKGYRIPICPNDAESMTFKEYTEVGKKTKG